MILKVKDLDDGAILYQDAAFDPKFVNKNDVIKAAEDVAITFVVLPLFPKGFGMSKIDSYSKDAGILTRSISCSGRNIRITWNEDGSKNIENNSVPDRRFEIVVEDFIEK